MLCNYFFCTSVQMRVTNVYWLGFRATACTLDRPILVAGKKARRKMICISSLHDLRPRSFDVHIAPVYAMLLAR